MPGLHGVGSAEPVEAKEPAGQISQSSALVIASLRPGANAKLSSRRPGAAGGANGGAKGGA